MKITIKNKLTGTKHTEDLPVEQWQIDAWRKGMLIQNVMPDLEAWQREFLITGMNKAEQDEFYSSLKEVFEEGDDEGEDFTDTLNELINKK